MKEQLGNIWTETDNRGVMKIGFSREYIETKLGECFHVMQADTKFARKGQPLLVLETNDACEKIKSPLTGTILVFNTKAANYPDRLTTEDTIMEVLPEGVKLPELKKFKLTGIVDDSRAQSWPDLWAPQEPPAPPPQANEADVRRVWIEEQRVRLRDAQQQRPVVNPRGRRVR
jgi:hypothetical protein